MARTNYETNRRISAAELRNPVLFVVDMVNGFARAGALADPAIEECAGPIGKLIETHPDNVWFICDQHEPGCKEFDAFPQHCLKGSEESEVIEELKPYVNHVIPKNCISAFASDDFQKVIRDLKEPCDLIVTGCCTDLCILQLALPLQSWIHQSDLDMRVIVPVDCVDTYNIPDVHEADAANEQALKMMEASGVTVVDAID